MNTTLTISLNGGPAQTGGVDAAASDVVQIGAQDKSGWGATQWQIWGYSDPSFACPSGYTPIADDGDMPAYVRDGRADPPSFTIPAGVALTIRALITDTSGRQYTSPDIIARTPFANGMKPVAVREQYQFGGAKAAVAATLNDNVVTFGSHTHPNATTDIAGFMSPAHVVALNTATSFVPSSASLTLPLNVNGEYDYAPTGTGTTPFVLPIASSGHALDHTVNIWLRANDWTALYVAPDCAVSGDATFDSSGLCSDFDATKAYVISITCVDVTSATGRFSGVIRKLDARDTTAPTVVSATVASGNPDALVVVFSKPMYVGSLTDLSLSFSAGTTRTITAVESGNGTTTVTFTLSGNFSGTEVCTFVVGTHCLAQSMNGVQLASGSTSVTVSFVELPLTKPGTVVGWWGADSVTFSTGSNIDTLVDKSSSGNTVTLGAGATRATQSTTGGGHKKAVFGASSFYQKSALSANIPANHSGTLYIACKISNWTPSGGYAAPYNASPDAVEGSGHYDAGFYVTPSAGAYWTGGYGTDGNLSYSHSVDALVHVWAFVVVHDGTIKVYKDGSLVHTSATITPDPGAIAAIRIGTLWFASHVCCEMDLYQMIHYVSSDTSAAHDATTVAAVSTYLSALTT